MFIDPALNRIEQGDRNKVMTCHALNIANGSTMLCHYIKSGVIKRYIAVEVAIAIDHHKLDLMKNKHVQKA